MFDFPMTEHSMGTAFYCLLTYMFILCFNYKTALKAPYTHSVKRHTKQMQILLTGFIIVTFCNKGDFFHLMEHVYDYQFIPGAYNYGEDVYINIAKLVGKNYFLFRTIVWGGSFVLFCWTLKRLDVPVYYAVILLFCIYVVTFSYGRFTAATAVYFFGVSFLCMPIKNLKLLSYIIGIIIIYTSWEFHNSAIIMIITTLILLVPFKKWSIALILIGIPGIVAIAKDQFYIIAQFAEANDNAIGERMFRYTQNIRGSIISQTILNTFKYLSFYIPIIISSIVIFTKNNINKIPIPIIRMYKVTFGVIFMASILYLLGPTFYPIFSRVLFMSMIPLCIIITALYKEGYMTRKQFRLCYIFGLIHTILSLVYTVYDIYVNS